MVLISRIIIIAAVLGVVWFFWPFGKFDDEMPVEPPRADSGLDQIFTKPLSSEPNGEASRDGREGAEEEDAAEDVAAVTPKDDVQQGRESSQLKPKRFYRVVVQDGSSLKAGTTTIKLAEIEVEGLTSECTDSRGEAWPCGRAARSALMRLIRGRAVECQVPASGDTATLKARCSVGGKDLSFWMVTLGWAKPKQPAQAAFKEAEEAARERRLGIWR
jgi:endonuclease YncB( thermonuclease family)